MIEALPAPVPIRTENLNKAKIKVIGVGGGGNNAVNYMAEHQIGEVELIICNTDSQVLNNSPVKRRLHIGQVVTKGLGTGCDPERGRKAAEESIEEIKDCFSDGTDVLFITAGMGGGTGTGASPVIAKAAREMGILTIGVVTLPFKDEKNEFMRRAVAGIHELKKHIDSLLIIENQKIYEMYKDLSLLDAFPKVNEVLHTAVKSIADIINYEGFINVDLNDVKNVMRDSGMALLGIGEADGKDRAIEAAKRALSSPLLYECDLKTAKNVLINIVMSEKAPMSAEEMQIATEYINGFTQSAQRFKRGLVLDNSVEEKISITLVATGFRIENLPSIEQTSINPEDVVTIEEDDEVRSHNRAMMDRMQETFSKTGFAERYRSLPEKPSLIIEPGEKITPLENVPAYKRLNIDIFMTQSNTVTEEI